MEVIIPAFRGTFYFFLTQNETSYINNASGKYDLSSTDMYSLLHCISVTQIISKNFTL